MEGATPISRLSSDVELDAGIGVDAEADENIDDDVQDEEEISWGTRLD